MGEGANLGFTQAGRIAFARSGGERINTDAIDNSAGVDTSDHEVNIKILTGQAIALRAADRARTATRCWPTMTDDIAAYVLAYNYMPRPWCSPLQEAEATTELDGHGPLHGRELVGAGTARPLRSRACPGPAALAELSRTAGKGLTRPELAAPAWADAKLELGPPRSSPGRPRTILISS